MFCLPILTRNPVRRGDAGAHHWAREIAKLAALNKPNEFIPLGMRLPNGVRMASNPPEIWRMSVYVSGKYHSAGEK